MDACRDPEGSKIDHNTWLSTHTRHVPSIFWRQKCENCTQAQTFFDDSRQATLLPAVVTLCTQQGSSCYGTGLVKLLLRLSQWHDECLASGATHPTDFWEDFEKFFQYWFNVSWDLHFSLWLSFSSYKCIAGQTFIQDPFSLIVDNNVHYRLTFTLITLLFRS